MQPGRVSALSVPIRTRVPMPLLALALAGCLPPWSAPAAARTMQQKLEQACASDIDRLCASAKPDPDRIKACMLTRRAEVSHPCIDLFDASE